MSHPDTLFRIFGFSSRGSEIIVTFVPLSLYLATVFTYIETIDFIIGRRCHDCLDVYFSFNIKEFTTPEKHRFGACLLLWMFLRVAP